MNCPKLVTKCNTPRIIWYQADNAIIIRILLQEVKQYFLRVECDYFSFSTVINSKNYYVCLHLFGTVVAEKTIHVNTGREIKVTLMKAHKWTDWLRLHFEREKNPMISFDVDRVQVQDWTMDILNNKKRESFTEYKRRHNITQIMPDVPSSDEDISDEEWVDLSLL